MGLVTAKEVAKAKKIWVFGTFPVGF
jgi:hypothetical protein